MSCKLEPFLITLSVISLSIVLNGTGPRSPFRQAITCQKSRYLDYIKMMLIVMWLYCSKTRLSTAYLRKYTVKFCHKVAICTIINTFFLVSCLLANITNLLIISFVKQIICEGKRMMVTLMLNSLRVREHTRDGQCSCISRNADIWYWKRQNCSICILGIHVTFRR